MPTNPGDFVMPGETITNINSVKNITIIGPGLRRGEQVNTLNVTQAGKFCYKSPNVYWIEGRCNRYIPKKGDLVVGIVVKKSGDILRVDIGSAEFATLSMFAFEGATKKQRPDVQIGDCVYAKLLNAHREMEPELVCIDSYFKAGNLGILPNSGFLVNFSSKVTHKLLNIDNPLLRKLGEKFPFQICVGVNGKVWMDSRDCLNILTIIKSFYAIENHSENDIIEVCRKIK